jgi:hypothetical protein
VPLAGGAAAPRARQVVQRRGRQRHARHAVPPGGVGHGPRVRPRQGRRRDAGGRPGRRRAAAQRLARSVSAGPLVRVRNVAITRA